MQAVHLHHFCGIRGSESGDVGKNLTIDRMAILRNLLASVKPLQTLLFHVWVWIGLLT